MGANKEQLEIEKLSLEIKNLRRKFFEHPTFWLSVVSAIVAVGGIFFQSQRESRLFWGSPPPKQFSGILVELQGQRVPFPLDHQPGYYPYPLQHRYSAP